MSHRVEELLEKELRRLEDLRHSLQASEESEEQDSQTGELTSLDQHPADVATKCAAER